MKYTNDIKTALNSQKAHILDSVEKHKRMIESFPMARRPILNTINETLFGEDNLLKLEREKQQMSNEEYDVLKEIVDSTYDEFEIALSA